MTDYVRVASAVTKVYVADVEKNTEDILKKYNEAAQQNTDIVVFPELCVTGYTCADLFFQSTLLESAKKAIKQICAESCKLSAAAVIGAPIAVCGVLYNCAVVICGGKVCGIVPKTMIPNYNEFYEKRWFGSSENLKVEDIGSREIGLDGDYNIPIGRNLLFKFGDALTCGIEVCEDLWAPISPGSFLALNGAELILNLSASNETILKHDYRKTLVSQQSAGTICCYVYTSAGGEESTTDLVFSGHSIIAENGTVVAENKRGIDSDYMLVCDLDIGKIKADRQKNTTFRDSAAIYGELQPCRIIDIDKKCESSGEMSRVDKLPFVPSRKQDRLRRCMDIFELQVAALSKRMSVVGFRPVVGVSGGLDSTLALLVCAEALKRAGKKVSDVTGITMPCFGTSDRTHSNSIKLMETLGVTQKEINIKEACSLHFADIGQNPEKYDVTYENCQARERTQVLMDYAGKIGGFVVGTGDLSELALGWCTYNADHMSMYGVNAGVPKTLVRWMIDSIAEYNLFPESTDVLKDITDTPISPELLPPDEEGKISQQTEDIVGPYALHDFFLFNVVRYGFSPSKIYTLAKRAFHDDFDSTEILKWLKNFYKRFFTQQFKRSCLPDGVKIGSICLSPRGDWRMPSDASCAVWLREAENLEP